MRRYARGLLDEGSFLEIQALWARELTVGFGRLDGEVVGVPVSAAGEIYYTFADADELRRVCESNNFTFADDCAYYSNFAPTGADLLSRLPSSAKITVIDHTGDAKFDAVFVTEFRQAEVVSTDPLRVQLGQTAVSVQRYDATDVFTPGQTVLYSEVQGVGYIRPME